jgi:hypothetical protein
MLEPLEVIQRSLITAFLLDISALRLVNLILSALWTKVEIPRPQKVIGELAHSDSQELAGNSSDALMWKVQSLSSTLERKVL